MERACIITPNRWKDHSDRPVGAARSYSDRALGQPGALDQILSDIGMPETDGHQMLMQIRADTLNRSTPSALTGYGTLRDVEKANTVGFDLHLRKPIDLQTVIYRQ